MVPNSYELNLAQIFTLYEFLVILLPKSHVKSSINLVMQLLKWVSARATTSPTCMVDNKTKPLSEESTLSKGN